MPSGQRNQPVRLDQFMKSALERYYHNRDPFGLSGDFTTAPEISQLFGEMIGIWALRQWMALGSPESFNLIEIGPGRGTLMSDLIRGTQHIRPFHDARHTHLIETSPTLTKKQKTLLAEHTITWHENLDHFQKTRPTIIIANEFFDALPVRQFQKKETGWEECYVHGTNIEWKDIKEPPTKNTLPDPNTNDIYEYSIEQEQYAKIINDLCDAALIIDYGYEKSAYGDSLQALYKHSYCDITAHVGEADITSHVDFEWLGSFFPDKQSNIISQREFLKDNGIDLRFRQLNDAKLESGYKRLIDPKEMGELFKVLEITIPNL